MASSRLKRWWVCKNNIIWTSASQQAYTWYRYRTAQSSNSTGLQVFPGQIGIVVNTTQTPLAVSSAELAGQTFESKFSMRPSRIWTHTHTWLNTQENAKGLLIIRSLRLVMGLSSTREEIWSKSKIRGSISPCWRKPSCCLVGELHIINSAIHIG